MSARPHMCKCGRTATYGNGVCRLCRAERLCACGKLATYFRRCADCARQAIKHKSKKTIAWCMGCYSPDHSVRDCPKVGDDVKRFLVPKTSDRVKPWKRYQRKS